VTVPCPSALRVDEAEPVLACDDVEEGAAFADERDAVPESGDDAGRGEQRHWTQTSDVVADETERGHPEREEDERDRTLRERPERQPGGRRHESAPARAGKHEHTAGERGVSAARASCDARARGARVH
jgi:hypothetical protein